MATPIRYGVVGLGHIAQAAVLPAFAHARRNSQLTAVVSDRPPPNLMTTAFRQAGIAIHLAGGTDHTPTPRGPGIKADDETPVGRGPTAMPGGYGVINNNFTYHENDAGFWLQVPVGWRMSRIGSLVCFRDPIHAQAAWKAGRRAEVVQAPDGSPYAKYGGFTNFVHPAVRTYNIALAVAAAKLGVDEILYDYVRRPDGPRSSMSFPGLKGEPEAAIASFLAESRAALAKTDVLLGASVFGVAATRPEDRPGARRSRLEVQREPVPANLTLVQDPRAEFMVLPGQAADQITNILYFDKPFGPQARLAVVIRSIGRVLSLTAVSPVAMQDDAHLIGQG